MFGKVGKKFQKKSKKLGKVEKLFTKMLQVVQVEERKNKNFWYFLENKGWKGA